MSNTKTTEEILAEALKQPETPVTDIPKEPGLEPTPDPAPAPIPDVAPVPTPEPATPKPLIIQEGKELKKIYGKFGS